MRKYVKSIEAIIEEMGGFWVNDDAVFRFGQPVSSDNCQTITLKKAQNIEKELMDDLEFPGALIGHPMDDSDDNCIHFQNTRLLDVEL